MKSTEEENIHSTLSALTKYAIKKRYIKAILLFAVTIFFMTFWEAESPWCYIGLIGYTIIALVYKKWAEFGGGSCK